MAGAFFLFFPHLKPGADDCPGISSGRIGAVDVQPATWGDYLSQIGQPTNGRSPDDLALRGIVVHYVVETSGYRGKHLPLRWTLREAASKAPAADPALKNQLALVIQPRECTDQLGQPIWIPGPEEKGKFYAQLVLYDESGAIVLDAENTTAFRA